MQIYYLNSKGLKYISQVCGVDTKKIEELNKENDKNFVYVPNADSGVYVVGNFNKEKLISVDNDDNISELKKQYNLKGDIQAGDVFLVNNTEKYVVQPLDTMEKICEKLGIDESYIIEKNNLKTDKLFIGQILMV